ncbi:SAF domain-containing protein [Sphingobium sp. EM0848]|uniref:SAF domain-containing protein n=1 Tax=Sphingobium sp. EM0848 TaxID=2743473 RepID=UPI00159C9917
MRLGLNIGCGLAAACVFLVLGVRKLSNGAAMARNVGATAPPMKAPIPTVLLAQRPVRTGETIAAAMIRNAPGDPALHPQAATAAKVLGKGATQDLAAGALIPRDAVGMESKLAIRVPMGIGQIARQAGAVPFAQQAVDGDGELRLHPLHHIADAALVEQQTDLQIDGLGQLLDLRINGLAGNVPQQRQGAFQRALRASAATYERRSGGWACWGRGTPADSRAPAPRPAGSSARRRSASAPGWRRKIGNVALRIGRTDRLGDALQHIRRQLGGRYKGRRRRVAAGRAGPRGRAGSPAARPARSAVPPGRGR